MKTTSIAAAVALSMGLASCAAVERRFIPPGQAGPGPCKEAVCEIMVTVTDCEVAVDDPEKHVPRENRRPTLRWRLEDAAARRYAFTEDGITFKRDPGGQMRPLGRSLLGSTFEALDINDAPGRFEYRVQITRRFGAACPTKDSWIVDD